MEKDLKGLLIDELHDILSAEEQIVKALPDMVKAANSPDLKKAFEKHLQETKGQIQRLIKIFSLLKVKREQKFCKATNGLIQECKEVLKDLKTKSPLRDAALISKAQRIEHYEISAYGTMRTFAKELGQKAVADLLRETENEEAHADKKLTKIAKGGLFSSGVNEQAIKPSATPDIKKKISAPKKKKVSAPKKIVKKKVSAPKKIVKKKISAPIKAKKITSKRK